MPGLSVTFYVLTECRLLHLKSEHVQFDPFSPATVLPVDLLLPRRLLSLTL